MIAAAVRWFLASTIYLSLNSDQVMVGLMARRMLAGVWPTFYWGQPYNGTLESAITAAIFRLAGTGYAAVHVAPVAFSLLYVSAAMLLGYQLYGRSIALLTGLYLACGPALLLRYSVWPGYNYLECMAFGTLALVLVVPIARGAGWKRLPPAAFLLGLGLWAQPLAIVYLPAIALLLGGPAVATWRAGTGRWRLPVAGAAAIGALVLALLPAILYNLHAHPTTLGFLLGRPLHLQLTLLERIRRTVLWSGPVFTGLIPPATSPERFQQFVDRHLGLYGGALLLQALGLLLLIHRHRTLRRWCRSLVTARPAGEGALLVLAVTLIGAYLFSTWSSSSWSASEPRYLLPLFTLAPLLIRALFPARASALRHSLGAAILIVMVIGGLAANSTTLQPANVQALAGYLQRRGDTALYGSYWMVYPVAFLTQERIIPVVVSPALALGFNRYPPYVRAGLHASEGAWAVQPHSATERALVRCLARHHQVYGRRTLVLATVPWVILDRISPGATCLRR